MYVAIYFTPSFPRSAWECIYLNSIKTPSQFQVNHKLHHNLLHYYIFQRWSVGTRNIYTIFLHYYTFSLQSPHHLKALFLHLRKPKPLFAQIFQRCTYMVNFFFIYNEKSIMRSIKLFYLYVVILRVVLFQV